MGTPGYPTRRIGATRAGVSSRLLTPRQLALSLARAALLMSNLGDPTVAATERVA
jgi:hypothetical protein